MNLFFFRKYNQKRQLSYLVVFFRVFAASSRSRNQPARLRIQAVADGDVGAEAGGTEPAGQRRIRLGEISKERERNQTSESLPSLLLQPSQLLQEVK